MSLLEGRAKKYDGTAIDYVSIFNWSDGKCIGQAIPNASGNWYYYHNVDTTIGITYVADGCEPITHGAYSVERNNDLNPDWVVINSPFTSDLTDLVGKTWTAHGDANVSGGALQLDGNGDYLYMPYHEDISFSNSEDVTIRFKAKINSFSSGFKILLTTRIDGSIYTGGTSNWGIFAKPNGIYFIVWSGTSSVPAPTEKNWDSLYIFDTEFEMSLERKDMVWRLYVDGLQHGDSVAQAFNYRHAKDASLVIGSEVKSSLEASNDTSRDLSGFIRNLQIMRGVALGGGESSTPIMD